MQVFEEEEEPLLEQRLRLSSWSGGIAARFIQRTKAPTETKVTVTLSGSKLLVSRNSEVSIIELSKTRCRYVEEAERSGFRLSRGQHQLVLLSRDQELVIEWQMRLMAYCLNQNFDQYYRLGAKIGSGSSSQVYSATRISDYKQFAVKVLRVEPQLYQTIRNQVSILRETSTVCAKLVQVFIEQSRVYLVLGLAERGHLLNYLRQEGESRFPKLVPKVMLKLLTNISLLHSLNIIHRDIKPQNIVIDSDQRLYLIDYGIACLANSKGCETRCGTPSYVAPEILQGKSCDQKCDVFSAGLVFYLLLTGQKAFSSSLQSVRQQISKGAVKIPERVKGQERALLKMMLDFNPDTRVSAKQALNHPYFVDK